ncbi:MAG: PilT/PilU family type 4a pilus ATPase [bacterium]
MSAITLEELMRLTFERNASDLLLTAGAPPQLRINGFLESIGTEPLEPETTRALAYSLLDEKHAGQLQEARTLDLSWGFDKMCRFRGNIYFQRDAIAMVMRRIPFVIPSFEELGVPKIVKDFAFMPNGLVLITGPAGSGKSTTMAAMVDYISRNRQMHVVCIEDPIEYLHAHHRSIVDQREIGQDARSFSEALRSVFRQSPDVIMVGEMRDTETMQLALSLAETGHLILATLHTQDTTHAVNRIVDSFPHAQQQQIYNQLSLVLVGVVSQQLIISKDGRSRVLACEVMNVNNAIRNLIREMQPQQIYSVIETGRSENMSTMNDSLARLCESDVIDVDVAMSRSLRPKELVKRLEVKLHSKKGEL